MSIAAIEWVFRQDIRPSAVKFVLVALADNAGDTGEAWPSIFTICEKTSQDRKTVIRALNQLGAMGLIKDTGRRMGSTHQVKVYRLIRAVGTVPDAELLNSSAFPSETVPYFRGNSPKNGTRNRQGTVNKNRQPPTVPQGGPSDLVSEFEEAKRIICSDILKGKDPGRPWSYEATEELSRQLPIPVKEFKLLAWFHGIPDDKETPELRDRRRSETTLAKFWSDEVTRAESYRKKIGAIINGHVSPRKKEPERWREFFRWKYGDEVRLPAVFSELDSDQRNEFAREHEEFERNALTMGVVAA